MFVTLTHESHYYVSRMATVDLESVSYLCLVSKHQALQVLKKKDKILLKRLSQECLDTEALV